MPVTCGISTRRSSSMRIRNLEWKWHKGVNPMDITYTVELTEAQYAALLDRAAELEIPLEDLLLQAIQNQVKEREHHA